MLSSFLSCCPSLSSSSLPYFVLLFSSLSLSVCLFVSISLLQSPIIIFFSFFSLSLFPLSLSPPSLFLSPSSVFLFPCLSWCMYTAPSSFHCMPTAPDYTTTPAPCEDAVPNCENFGESVCTNVAYDDWVNSNCRKFCNRCCKYIWMLLFLAVIGKFFLLAKTRSLCCFF